MKKKVLLSIIISIILLTAICTAAYVSLFRIWKEKTDVQINDIHMLINASAESTLSRDEVEKKCQAYVQSNTNDHLEVWAELCEDTIYLNYTFYDKPVSRALPGNYETIKVEIIDKKNPDSIILWKKDKISIFSVRSIEDMKEFMNLKFGTFRPIFNWLCIQGTENDSTYLFTPVCKTTDVSTAPQRGETSVYAFIDTETYMVKIYECTNDAENLNHFSRVIKDLPALFA